MMKKFMQEAPLLHKVDTISYVRKLMNKFSIPELPVVDEENLLGTISAKKIVEIGMKGHEIENFLVINFLEKDFLQVESICKFSDLIKNFLETKKWIACIIENNKFIGYVQRIKFLELLLNVELPAKKFLCKDFIEIDENENIRKILKKLKLNLPILVTRNSIPVAAFSPEEMNLFIFVSNYFVGNFGRDFETLKGEKRKFLKRRLDQEFLAHKKRELDGHLPLVKISDIPKEGTVVKESSTVAKVAKIMLEKNRSVVAVHPYGVISDLSLLSGLT